MLFQLTKCVKVHPVEVVDWNSHYCNRSGNRCKNCVHISQVYPASFGYEASQKTPDEIYDSEDNHDAVRLDCGGAERCFRVLDLFLSVWFSQC